MTAISGGRLESARILVVDDEEANVRLLRRILSSAGYEAVQSTTRGREVAGLFATFSPDLVALDLHMPDHDGFAVLRDLAPEISRGYLPVLILTGDDSIDAKRGALSLGATDFLAKPFDATEVLLRIRNLLQTRFLYRALENHNSVLETRVQERTHELRESQIEILERLTRTAEIRDDDTGRHTHRVGELSGRLAGALGFESRTVDLISRAAPLHDLGKIGIPDSILLKPGNLTAEELAVMRTHTTIGADLLSGGRSVLLAIAERIALSHHERWDGGGYPHGISAEGIPIEARLVAVADFLDALTHHRPYRAAWTLEDTLEELERGSGSHFDPEVVAALIRDKCYVRIQLTPPDVSRAVGADPDLADTPRPPRSYRAVRRLA